MASANPL